MKPVKFFSVLLLFSLLLCACDQKTTHIQGQYPQGFLWGAAFSAHQTEGAFEGGEGSDWWQFEHSLSNGISPIANADTADISVDHWHRYAEDYEWAKRLGLKTLRTSLAWEKIEPSPGVFNEKVMNVYRAQFKRMRELGIRPMIALHHFVHPRWFHEQGGWLSPESPKWFLRYATYVVKNLGDYCDLWITFNEPMILVMMGYLKGEIPPQEFSLEATYEAAFQMARAHRMVASMIHEVQGLSPNARGDGTPLRGVGLANALPLYDPYDPRDPRDVRAAQIVADISNWAFLEGLEKGRLRFELPAELPPEIPRFDRPLPMDDLPRGQVGPVMDWMGVNYYTRFLIRYNEKSALKVEWVNPSGSQGDNTWAIQPEGLERILRQTAERFKLPLVVTENGLADAKDQRRADFIRDHLRSLDGAVLGSAQGPALDVRGYYHWSLMDNFEWLHGYKYRFGLIEIQYNNDLKRVPRPSADVYTKEIESRTAPEPNVILITLDGARWQEFFHGIDPSVSGGETGVVFPFLRERYAPEGISFGNPNENATMVCANPVFKSLPAYHSIMAGKVQDCPDNECGRIRVETLPERLQRELELLPVKVASIASWDKLRESVESVPGKIFSNAWNDALQDGEKDAELARLNEAQIKDNPWETARLDRYTLAHALRYLKKHRPRFLYISLNDTDEWGHAGNYAGYLSALRQYDSWFHELIQTLEGMGEYGKNTSILITTDHGRGEGSERWRHHGKGIAESRFIWLYARTPYTRTHSVKPKTGYSHVDIRPTVEALMGLQPIRCDGCGIPMPEIVGSR